MVFLNDSCGENDLIEKSKKGNNQAFEKLMSNYFKIIYNYIITHVNANEDIKDIIQETMLSVWQGINGFGGKSTFKTWVLGITRRKIADYYRKLYKNVSVPLTEIEEAIYAKDEFESIHNSIAVENAITVLDKSEKEIVYLIFNAQLSYSEISEIIKIPVGTIKSKMSSIKTKLKKGLRTEGEYD